MFFIRRCALYATVDGLLDRYPNGPVTKETIYTSGSGLFKAQVEERSKGKIYVDLKLGGVLGVQAVDKIQQGIIQAGTATTQNCASLVPVWNVLDFPYVIGNAKNMAKIMYSKEINQTLRKKSEESGLINLGGTPFFRWLNLGRSVKQDVKRPADVKGLKLRVTNSRLELAGLEILGANPTPISGGEISTAMEQGVVDGFNIGPHFALDFNLIESVRYVVDTNFMPNTDCIFVGTRWMRSLPPVLQEAIMEAAFERQKYVMDFNEPVYRDQVGVSADSPPDSAFKKHGIKVHLLSDEERSVWIDAMSFERNPVLNELADRFGREELELVRAVVAEKGEPEPTRWWA